MPRQSRARWELSLALHDLSIDEKQVFLEGYGLAEKKFREMRRSSKHSNIINYAPEIGRLAEAKDPVKLEHIKLGFQARWIILFPLNLAISRIDKIGLNRLSAAFWRISSNY